MEEAPAAPAPALPAPAPPARTAPDEAREEEPPPPDVWDSVLTRLRRHAEARPAAAALSFLRTDGGRSPAVASSLAYGPLHAAVEYLAARLRPPSPGGHGPARPPGALAPGLAREDRVLLVYPPCAPHFVLGFLACLGAGLVAVPVYPPHPGRRDGVAAFVGVARGCGARVALTSGEYTQAKRLGELKNAFTPRRFKKRRGEGGAGEDSWPEDLTWVVTDKEPLEAPPAPATYSATEATPGPREVAFIQYTSGSTSAPKGVTLTHANLSHNLTIITNELGASSDTTVVSWLPQYHDMGLIGSLVGIIYCGGRGFYMSPIAFLQRPMGWLEAVSEYRGTHLQAPNFAFGLTARKFDPGDYRRKGDQHVNGSGKQVKPLLDLSCLRHVINGADPVTAKSMGAFIQAFTPFGLPEGVIYPTYGLAEHTIVVCSGGVV